MAEPSPFRGGTAGAAVECGGCTRAIRYSSTSKRCDRIERGCSYLLTATYYREFLGAARMAVLKRFVTFVSSGNSWRGTGYWRDTA